MKNIIQWKPFGEMDRFVEDGLFPSFPKFSSDLAIDLYEEKGMVIAKMSLPGIDAREVDISIEDDILTIMGSREEEHETEGKDYYSKEIRRGSFTRSIRLPASVEATEASATYRDGLLTVSMPAIAGKESKAVKVTVK